MHVLVLGSHSLVWIGTSKSVGQWVAKEPTFFMRTVKTLIAGRTNHFVGFVMRQFICFCFGKASSSNVNPDIVELFGKLI